MLEASKQKMNHDMEARVNGPTNQAVCSLMDWAEKKELERNGHIHYHCPFEIRGEKLFHICSEQNKEWEIK